MVRAEQRDLIPWLTAQIGVRGLYLRGAASLPAELSGNMLQTVTSVHRHGQRLAGDFHGDDHGLPLLGDSLQLAYALHVLETSPSPAGLLDELARCLQPEGVLVLVVWSRFSPWRWTWRTQSMRCFTHDWIRRTGVDVGLHLERHSVVGPCWPLLGEERLAADERAQAERRPWIAPWHTSSAYILRKRRAGMTAVGRVAGVRMQPRAWPT